MKIKNVSTSNVIISDIKINGAGLSLAPDVEVLIFDEDAEKSPNLKQFIADGVITKTGDEEPTTGVADADAPALVTAHSALTTGVHGVAGGTIAKVADIAVDANLSAEGQDAITKRHDGAVQDTAIALKLDALKLAVVDSTAGAGGGVSEALTVTGLLADDTILAVSQKTAGANGVAIIGFNTLIVDGLTVVYTADPGAGSVVSVLVLRA